MKNIVLLDLKSNREKLLPFTLTRPISEIRVGIMTIREKWELFLDQKVSYFTEDYLQGKYPFVEEESNIFVNATIIPDSNLANKVKALKKGDILIKGDSTFMAVHCTTKELQHIQSGNYKFFSACDCKRSIVFIQYPWDIFRINGEQINSDFETITHNLESHGLNQTNQVIGDHPVFIEDGAEVNCAIINTTLGPVYIGKRATIMEGAILRGPLAVCNDSTIKAGAKIYEESTIGPHSKVGGEVHNSVIFGFSNKAHDGYLGNSVIGEWCNLGADTNVSNLKNNYENVKVWSYAEQKFVSTGLQFCGLLMADHSKCGINTMFNTGTVVGVSCNIYGAGFPRTYIPSFSWGGAQGTTEYRLDKVYHTAELVMSRRHIDFSDEDKSILGHVFNITKENRH